MPSDNAISRLNSILLKKEAKCWEGYERVPGTKPMTPGSCRPAGSKKDTKEKSEKKGYSAKQSAEKCECYGKSPCACPPNCSCGCKHKSAAAKPGLWANIHAKKERGEAPAKPGSKDYPTAKNWKKVTNESEKKALFSFGGSKPQQPKPLTPKEIAQFAAEDAQDAAEEEHYNKKMELLKNLQKNKTQENIHNYLSHWMKVPGATNPNVKHDSFWDPSDSLETLVEDLPWAKKDLKSPYFQEDLSELLYSPLTQSFKTDEDKAKAINEVASRFFPHIPKQVVKKASPAWQTSEGKSESGGLNDKGRASLKAQGHDIKRPQPEGGPRKDSFCARMKGMKSKLTSSETANDPDSRINKSLRKWKCGSAAEKLASLLPMQNGFNFPAMPTGFKFPSMPQRKPESWKSQAAGWGGQRAGKQYGAQLGSVAGNMANTLGKPLGVTPGQANQFGQAVGNFASPILGNIGSFVGSNAQRYNIPLPGMPSILR